MNEIRSHCEILGSEYQIDLVPSQLVFLQQTFKQKFPKMKIYRLLLPLSKYETLESADAKPT